VSGLQPDTQVFAPPVDVALPDDRPRTTLDLAVAKLRTALQERSGYVIVTADSATTAEALFATVEPRLKAFRTVRAAGGDLDPEAVVRSLWREGEAPFPARLAMRTLLDDARAAGQPIIVAVTDADGVDPARLERVRLTLEGTPDAGEILRIALLGGPGLIELLRQPEARGIAMRIGASVTVPSAEANLPAAVIPPPAAEASPWRGAIGAVTGVAALVAAIVAWSVWPGAEPLDPPDASAPPPAVVAQATGPLQPAAPVPAPLPQQEAAAVQANEPPIAVAPEPPPAPPAAVVVKPEATPPAVQPPAAQAPGAPAPTAPAPGETAHADAEAPPAAREASAPKSEPAPRGAALQIGAFVRADGAETVRQKLAEQFPSVYVSPAKRSDGTTFHRVRIGGFRSTHDLDLAAAVLRTAGYSPLRVRE